MSFTSPERDVAVDLERHDDDAALGERVLGTPGRRGIGRLHDDPRDHLVDVVLADGVGDGGRDEDVGLDADDRVARQLLHVCRHLRPVDLAVLVAQVEQGDVELLWKYLDNEPGAQITVDLGSRTIHAGELVVPFAVDDYIRWRLMEGLDDISLTLRHEDDIEAFEDARPSWKPSTLVR